MTRIFDNLSEDSRLGAYAQAGFQRAARMDVATGYFNLRGWRLFTHIVEDKIAAGSEFPVCRILIGMVQGSAHEELVASYQRQVEDDDDLTADREIAVERRRVLLKVMREQLSCGIPTPTDRVTLSQLYQQVKSGAVQIKVFCDQPLHGKAYIFHDPTSFNAKVHALVGSSNLTHPGLMTNLELNTDVVDSDGAAKLDRWFIQRWEDQFSLPIDEDLLEVLNDSWASPTNRSPYDVYLKVCYDLSRDAREGLEEYSLSGPIKDKLLDFQATAVKTLARRIMTRGGTMLGDVVGLGKTLTAIAVALMLRDEHGYQPLVVCPKNLVEMWERHLEAYDLHGRVVPYSMNHTLAETRRYPFVIVDESHTLRNEKTQTYQNIQNYIRTNDSKALLLTATPFNTRFADVANQLGLFIDEDDDLGLQPVKALANYDFADTLEFGVSTLAAFRKSDEAEDWKRLMGEHLVRRTRSFIKDNYAEKDLHGREYLTFCDGSKFFFPDRKAIPVDHQFWDNDPAALMVADSTLDAITELKLPRYDLHSYLSQQGEKQANEREREVLEDLKRSRGHVSGFVRTNFFKRLSSCGHSFILSLQRHLSRNRLFLYAIENNLPIPVGTVDANVLLGDQDAGEDSSTTLNYATGITDPHSDYELLQAKDPAGLRWIRPSLFAARLRADLEADNQIIQVLLESFGPWSPMMDSKLAALIELATSKHPDEKLLIFTEYKDTANYLAAALAQLGLDKVGVATGDTEDPTAVAKRFSPKSNENITLEAEQTPEPVDELRVLVATDVLSEGQNLQDAHIVVNYDIPWAIIQLIQRAGRVDRVGQGSDTVLIYTISHGSVEDVLNLRRRVQQRLAANAATFGSDESFFDTDEEVQIIRDLYDGKLEANSVEEEVDATSLAYEVWNKALSEDPARAERIANLPKLIDATRPTHVGEDQKVFGHIQTESGMDIFACANAANEQVRLLTGHEALRSFECEPATPALDRLENHDALVKLMIKDNNELKELFNMAGRLRGERKILWNRLGGQLDYANDSIVDKAMDSVYQFPLTRAAIHRLRSLRRHGASDTDLLQAIKSLYLRSELTIPVTASGKDPIHIVSVMGASKK